ncbi:hypothetical protein AVEN_138517-1 [Araneus ventricosus]|uniref:Uncharacterized protein n=1 Tax=Araneus ventricosus TaxID=182803 RepID=A0A4Y2SHC1_ARAVE|nr:hypothetical protein AVEN_138517-1 [Araneus ventricosus]
MISRYKNCASNYMCTLKSGLTELVIRNASEILNTQNTYCTAQKNNCEGRKLFFCNDILPCFLEGRGGLEARSRFSRRAPGPKPDLTEDPPWGLAAP